MLTVTVPVKMKKEYQGETDAPVTLNDFWNKALFYQVIYQ